MSTKADNFIKALDSLERGLALPIENERDVAGIIQMFEFCYELSWKFLKEELEIEGVISTTPRDVLTKSYTSKLIDDEKKWLDMIKDRNLSVHTYNRLLADSLVEKIQADYIELFKKLRKLT